MRKRQKQPAWTVRPQLFVVLAAILAISFGLRPAAATVSVATADQQSAQVAHVLSALINRAQPAIPKPHPAPPPVWPAPDCDLQPCLALTFDDGPSAQYTPRVLDVLERHHVRATFFVVGSHVPGNEALLQRMYTDGDEIGNHSWAHTDFTTLTLAQMDQQIAQTQAAVAAAGVPVPTLFRPPYGAVNAVVRNHVPLTLALWNVDPEDWKAKSAEEVLVRVTTTAKPGAIIDMHDIHPHTAEALDPLLTKLEQSYQLVTVSDLLNLPPGQRGAYYGR